MEDHTTAIMEAISETAPNLTPRVGPSSLRLFDLASRWGQRKEFASWLKTIVSTSTTSACALCSAPGTPTVGTVSTPSQSVAVSTVSVTPASSVQGDTAPKGSLLLDEVWSLNFHEKVATLSGLRWICPLCASLRAVSGFINVAGDGSSTRLPPAMTVASSMSRKENLEALVSHFAKANNLMLSSTGSGGASKATAALTEAHTLAVLMQQVYSLAYSLQLAISSIPSWSLAIAPTRAEPIPFASLSTEQLSTLLAKSAAITASSAASGSKRKRSNSVTSSKSKKSRSSSS